MGIFAAVHQEHWHVIFFSHNVCQNILYVLVDVLSLLEGRGREDTGKEEREETEGERRQNGLSALSRTCLGNIVFL